MVLKNFLMYSVSFVFRSWQLNPYGQHTWQCLKLILQRRHFETRSYEARILVKIKGMSFIGKLHSVLAREQL